MSLRPSADSREPAGPRPVAAAGGPTVTSKVFAILGAFVPGEARADLTQISRRTGLPSRPSIDWR